MEEQHPMAAMTLEELQAEGKGSLMQELVDNLQDWQSRDNPNNQEWLNPKLPAM